MMQKDGYPTNWDDYDNVVVHVGAKHFSFSDEGDVNRFAARFRAAASFRGIKLEGYSAPTEEGYSALCRVLFAWSAFESFLKITGLDMRTVGPLFDGYGAAKTITAIRSSDPNDRFYSFIHARVNATHQAELDNYLKNDPCNIGYLSSAIRHIFAHGWLTPNANQVEPAAVTTVCNVICEFLLMVMDKEFMKRAAAGLDEIYGS